MSYLGRAVGGGCWRRTIPFLADDVNLNAIAAAVIGGASVFGGRGSAFSALLDILVIQFISSGLALLDLDWLLRRVEAVHQRLVSPG
jgi:ABC-type xylose transport system permease subunit